MAMQGRTSILVVIVLASLAVIGAGCSKSDTTAETSKPVATADAPISKWEGKLITRPGTGQIHVVQGGKRRRVLATPWLSEHGYKFPEDVAAISVEEFAAIPVGDPIQ
jgi:hypothetical protein